MYAADRSDALLIGYPVPGLGRVGGREGGRPSPADAQTDALDAVLGKVRGEILRYLAHTPTVTELARHLRISLSTATYHCQHLAAAGLLHRERYGREVRLLPTERGTALREVLSMPFPRTGR
jgi:DNA-binding transcriptional ArsR family regulator